MSSLRIEMLPAQQGDAILIEYGEPVHLNHVLIDAGTPPSYAALKQRLKELDGGRPHLELVIVSHIDTDHIGGVLKLFADPTLDAQIDDVWFNGWQHLPDTRSDLLGPVDGEILSTQLTTRKLPWNQAFIGHAVAVPDDGRLAEHTLPGGLRLTVLSPGSVQLINLRKEWRSVVAAAGLDPGQPRSTAASRRLEQLAASKGIRLDLLGAPTLYVSRLAARPFEADRAVANGSSIVVLAEYEGRSVLLGADGFPEVVAGSVNRLLGERQKDKLNLDAFKICHHGSKHNTSNELLAMLVCSRYFYSTNGNIFGHPDSEAVARVVVNGGHSPTLYFNYSSKQTAVWADSALMRQARYSAVFPDADATGLAVEL